MIGPIRVAAKRRTLWDAGMMGVSAALRRTPVVLAPPGHSACGCPSTRCRASSITMRIENDLSRRGFVRGAAGAALAMSCAKLRADERPLNDPAQAVLDRIRDEEI